MQNVLLAWFSVNGTTTAIAERIAAGLAKAGCAVTPIRIGKEKPPDLAAFDTVGIGTPTYVFRPPFVVTDFLRSLPDLTGKQSFAFVLHGTDRGACANQVRKTLARKHARDLGLYHSFGSDLFNGYLRRGVLFSPDTPRAQDLDAAERFGTSLAERGPGGARVPEPMDGPTHLIYAIERLSASRALTGLLWSRAFHADERCDNCGVCIAACPMHNITAQKDARPRWETHCLLGERDGIPFVRVTHSGGVTRRL
ncbi:MAG TPA: EFR1 family ferrodoxin [Spirochaetia bacterium]|nr:EFR1 family ferrodoxin [Spirochaetia bacterium]